MQPLQHFNSKRKDCQGLSSEVVILPMSLLRIKHEANLQWLVFYDDKDEPGGLCEVRRLSAHFVRIFLARISFLLQ